MKQVIKVVVTLVVIFININASNLQAQDENAVVNYGSLVYIKEENGNTQYVSLSSQLKEVYTLPPDTCNALSTYGTYVAQSSIEPTELLIRSLKTDSVVIQTRWEATWEPCTMFWLSDGILSILENPVTQSTVEFEVSDGKLTPIDYKPNFPIYPKLPGWRENTNEDFILSSPDPDFFLYERCESNQTIGVGENSYCDPPTDFVIYDLSKNQIVHKLQRIDPSLRTGFTGENFSDCRSVAWSSDGKYLAFPFIPLNLNQDFNLSIFELTTTQYLNTEYLNLRIDTCKTFQWSPVGNKLAIWLEGATTDEPYNPLTMRTLVFFDADTQQFTTAETTFSTEHLIEQPFGMWSPDGQSYVFIDLNHNLVQVDVDEGTIDYIDKGVIKLIVWRDGR